MGRAKAAYLSFEDARGIVRACELTGLRGERGWLTWSSTERPEFIPGCPHLEYEEYCCLGDWLRDGGCKCKVSES